MKLAYDDVKALSSITEANREQQLKVNPPFIKDERVLLRMDAGYEKRCSHEDGREHCIVELDDSPVDLLHLSICSQSECSKYQVAYKHADSKLVVMVLSLRPNCTLSHLLCYCNKTDSAH